MEIPIDGHLRNAAEKEMEIRGRDACVSSSANGNVGTAYVMMWGRAKDCCYFSFALSSLTTTTTRT